MWLIFLTIAALGGLFLLWAGAPYVPTHKKNLSILFNELGPGRERLFLDCGAGDGRLVIAAAREGFIAIGYELNPLVYAFAKWKSRTHANASIKFGFWQSASIQKFDVIYMFGSKQNIQRLMNKKPRALIVSYGFKPQDKVSFMKNIDPFWFVKF